MAVTVLTWAVAIISVVLAVALVAMLVFVLSAVYAGVREAQRIIKRRETENV